jgi:hypothetical protein
MNKLSLGCQSSFRVCDSYKNENGDNIPVIYGPLSFTEVISKKGYRYREGFWQKVLSSPIVKAAIESRSMLGMVEHPEDDNDYLCTPYLKASHLIISAQLKNSTPYGQIALLNNEQGNAIKALVDLKVPIGVSTRGLGEFGEDDISSYVKEDNYGLITWDFTKNPNLDNAYLALKVTDSLRNNNIFQEFIQAHGIKDSAETGPQDLESVKKDLYKMRNELNSIIEKL